MNNSRTREATVEAVPESRTRERVLQAISQQGPITTTALADGLGWDELNGQGHDHFQRLPAIIESINEALGRA